MRLWEAQPGCVLRGFARCTAFNAERLRVPTVPGFPLLLNQVIFDTYRCKIERDHKGLEALPLSHLRTAFSTFVTCHLSYARGSRSPADHGGVVR